MKKRFSHYFSALACAALFVAGSAPAWAGWRIVSHSADADGRLAYNEVEDGMLLVFQSAVTSDTTFYLYADQSLANLPNYTDVGGNKGMLGAASISEAGNNNQVFQVEWAKKLATTRANVGADLFYLKAYSTGLYVTGVDVAAGRIIGSNENHTLVLTSDKSKAGLFAFANGTSGTYSGGANYGLNGWAAEHFGEGRSPLNYAGNSGSTLPGRGSVAIAWNPDEMPVNGNRWLSIEGDMNVFCNSGYGRLGENMRNPFTLAGWGSTRRWGMYEVEIVSGAAALQNTLDQYTANGWTPQVFVGGTAPGYYDATAANSFASAWNTIEEAIAGGSVDDAEVASLQEDLRVALDDVQKTLKGVTDGYYSFISAATTQGAEALAGGTTLTGADGLTTAAYDASSAQQVFKLTASGTGFYIQNIGTDYYINTPGSTATNSLSAATVQLFTKLGAAGQFAISSSAAATQYYYGAASGVTLATAATPNSATAWQLVPVSEATAQSLIAASASLRDQLAMNRLVEQVESRIEATDTVVTLDEANPYISDASQLSSNAPETTTNPDQSVAMAIDGDVNTYFHTRWSAYAAGEVPPTEAHYLLADFQAVDGIQGDVAFRAVRRRNANGTIFVNSWPEQAVITASNDSVQWDTIKYVDLGNDGVAEYQSPIIHLDKNYRYLKFSLIKHSQSGPNGNGQYAFCLAEYNWYDASISDTRSASMREDTKQPLAALKSALATAKGISAPTQSDVATLQAALDAFNAVYPDASDLEAEIAAAQTLSGVPINDGVSGYYSTEAVNALRSAIAAASEGDIASLSKGEVDSRLATLKAAEDKFRWSYTVADSNKIYRLKAIGNVSSRPNMGYAYLSHDGRHQIELDASGTLEPKDAYYFTVKQVGDTVWAIQHVKTGYYINNPFAITRLNGYTCYTTSYDSLAHWVFRANGDGTFDVRPEGSTADWLYIEPASRGRASLSSNPTLVSCSFHWALEPVTDAQITMTRPLNDIQVLTLPFNTVGKPVALDGTMTNSYKVVGFYKDADTGEVTDIRVVTLQNDEPTPAGTPIILEINNKDQFDPASNDTVVFDCQVDTANIGLIAPTVVKEVDATVGNPLTQPVYPSHADGRLYFRGSLLYPLTSGQVTLPARTGWINLNHIVDTSANYDDADIVDIQINGSIVGIKNINADAALKGNVDVYSVDGVLVRKDVPAASATNGLPKGIYIVGGNKLLVK